MSWVFDFKSRAAYDGARTVLILIVFHNFSQFLLDINVFQIYGFYFPRQIPYGCVGNKHPYPLLISTGFLKYPFRHSFQTGIKIQ